MAIRFRCDHCAGLMSISSRKAGALVQCPTCGRETRVPLADAVRSPGELGPQAVPGPQPAPPPEPAEPDVVFSSLPPRRPADEDTVVQKPGAASTTALPRPGDELLNEALPGPVAEFDVVDDVEETEIPGGSLPEFVDETPASPDESEGSAFTLRRSAFVSDDMDLTPMVDVTFQLLIFFMVTASFAMQKSIEVPTPDPDKKGAAQQLQILDDLEGSSLQVQIDASNTILVEDEPVADPSRLAEVLKDKMRREQKTELLISAHPASLHRSVIGVIDAANSAGMQRIRMVSRKGSSE